MSNEQMNTYRYELVYRLSNASNMLTPHEGQAFLSATTKPGPFQFVCSSSLTPKMVRCSERRAFVTSKFSSCQGISCQHARENARVFAEISTLSASVTWRPCKPSRCKVHLAAPVFFFEKAGKPCKNLPTKCCLFTGCARTLYSCIKTLISISQL